MMEEIPIPNHRLGCFLKPLVKNGGSINSDKPFLNWFSRLAGMVECWWNSKARSSLLTYAAVGDGSSPHFDLATWTAGGRKWWRSKCTALFECEDECPFLLFLRLHVDHNFSICHLCQGGSDVAAEGRSKSDGFGRALSSSLCSGVWFRWTHRGLVVARCRMGWWMEHLMQPWVHMRLQHTLMLLLNCSICCFCLFWSRSNYVAVYMYLNNKWIYNTIYIYIFYTVHDIYMIYISIW